MNRQFDLKHTYLNTAYMGPMSKTSKGRVEEWLQTLRDPGFTNFEERLKFLAGVREKLARLLGARSFNIALGGSVSELVGHVANGLELHQGDNVVLMDGDFPSMILPWLVVAEIKGFQVRLLKRDVFLNPELFAKELNDRTRFAGCSHVMFNTGLRLPVAELGEQCREKDVLFMADVSQSFGAMRIAPEILEHADVLVGVTYKWLLGPYGSAFAYFSDRALEEVRRTHAAWGASANMRSTESLLDYTTKTLPGAVKFDRGEASTYLIMAALDGALDVMLEEGLAKIEKHNDQLARQFLDGLPGHCSSFSSTENLSPIVCFRSTREDSVNLKARLAKENIDLTIREGFLRASFHLFNTKEEVIRLLGCL